MQKFFVLFFSAVVCTMNSLAQISFTGNSSAISTPVNAPAITIDNTLSITTSFSINGAKVSITTNFNSGDILANTASLPSGVSVSYNSATGVLTYTGTATASQYQDLLRGVTFSTSSAVATQRTVTFELGDGSVKYNSTNGHYYYFLSGAYSWTAAKTEAESVSRKFFGSQGYLATVTTSFENSFVNGLSGKGWLGASDDYSYINAALGTSTYANQATSEGKWYWICGPEKGTQFSNGSTSVSGAYTYWNSGEPNNSSSAEHYMENAYAGGYWNDAPNTNTNNLIIEYGGISGDPVVDIFHSRPINLIATSLRSTATNNAYSLHATAFAVDNALTLYSASNITNATVTISSGFKTGDVLSYTGALPSGVTANYNSTTGVLSFTGTTSYSSWQTLLRTVTFYSSSNVVGNRSISFSVGNLISGSNGHFYEFVTPGTTWTTAKANAAARTYMGLTGYLATITSQTENDFIQQKLSADGWIGGSDAYGEINSAAGTSYTLQSQTEGKWYWVTGPEKGTQFSNGNTTPTQLTYMYWNSGEPNNSGSNENYAQIYSTSGTAPGKWNDLNGTGSLGYVVEYGGLSTDPLLELSASRTIVITNILPVSGLQFTAIKNGDHSELKWSTTTEVNTLRFDVLYSNDGRNYSKVSEVMAAQNSNTVRNYSFVHSTPSKGTNYYKLQMFDVDGRSTFSEIRQLNFGTKAFTISPNPVVNSFIVTNPFSVNASIVIKSVNGAVVMKQAIGSDHSSIDISRLSSGIYFAQIATEQQTSEIIKFIKK